MHYDGIANTHGLPHDPFTAIVAPRPIGWITAMSRQGALNLSPYSFFNAVSHRPHMVAFASDGRKDAITFIEETQEFVCNIVSWDLRAQMNATSAPLPRGDSEFDYAGVETAPSRFVAPPRVSGCPAALECRWTQTVPMTPLQGDARYWLVIGQVVGVYIDDAFVVDGRVDTAAMRLIARAGYTDYFAATPETRFSITRPQGG